MMVMLVLRIGVITDPLGCYGNPVKEVPGRCLLEDEGPEAESCHVAWRN